MAMKEKKQQQQDQHEEAAEHDDNTTENNSTNNTNNTNSVSSNVNITSSSNNNSYIPPAQRGVIFFSSIPRNMRPQELILHFRRFGPITRHKFTPYPKKETKPGGPLLPLQFKNGYLEFANVEDAKRAAAVMNGSVVECKRRRACAGQLWTVKYEKGLTWETLAEEKEGKLREKRWREAEARGKEKEMNEMFRAAVLAKARGRAEKKKKNGGNIFRAQESNNENNNNNNNNNEIMQKVAGKKRLRNEEVTSAKSEIQAVKKDKKDKNTNKKKKMDVVKLKK